MRIHLALLLLCGAGVVPAWGQSRVATSAAQFLTIGTGARGSSLGHAYTALATDADALYWNPAGAARATDSRNRGSVVFGHTQWMQDIDYNAFGLVVPVGAGVVGLSLAQLDYGRMERRTVDLPEGTGETFGASDLVLGLSYAQPLTDMFYIGGTFKHVRQSIYDMSAATYAFDVGFVLDSDYFNGLKIAGSIMNFGGKMQMEGINGRIFVDIDPTNTGSSNSLPARLETNKWDLPLSFKFGVALPVLQSENFRIDLLSDAQQTNDNGLNADLGAQAQFFLRSLRLDVRGGYKNLGLEDEATSHMTIGTGLSMNMAGLRFGLDYAYLPSDLFDAVQVIDLRLNF